MLDEGVEQIWPMEASNDRAGCRRARPSAARAAPTLKSSPSASPTHEFWILASGAFRRAFHAPLSLTKCVHPKTNPRERFLEIFDLTRTKTAYCIHQPCEISSTHSIPPASSGNEAGWSAGS